MEGPGTLQELHEKYCRALTVIAMALQLMLQVDKMAELSIGKLPELIKEFIAAQAPSTCGRDWLYVDNDRRCCSELPDDHDSSVKALRMSYGNVPAMSGPHLSLISLVKGWPR